MEILSLKAKTRTTSGSGAAGRLRREGYALGIVYGHVIEPLSIQVQGGELLRVLHTKAGENVIIELDIEGAKLKERTCQIKDIQHDPVTEQIQHVDFKLISMTETITVYIPLTVLHADECEGLKQGGVLDVVHHEIEIECLPMAIPEKVEIDLKGLQISDVIHLKDINLAEGAQATLPPDEVLVAIHAPRVEEEPTEEEEAPTAPEVIEKGKKDKPEEGEAAASEEKKASPKQ